MEITEEKLNHLFSSEINFGDLFDFEVSILSTKESIIDFELKITLDGYSSSIPIHGFLDLIEKDENAVSFRVNFIHFVNDTGNGSFDNEGSYNFYLPNGFYKSLVNTIILNNQL